jgi:hypothetical protein
VNELESVKVGDQLIRRCRAEKSVVRVARVTATQIITEKGGRFQKASGREVGKHDLWGMVSVDVPEPGEVEDIAAEARRAALAFHLSNAKWYTMPMETLEAAHRLLAAAPSNNTEGTE